MLDKRNFYINGRWTAPLKKNDFQVVNPSNEESCAIISLGDAADVNAAVIAAKEAFSNWSKTSKDDKIFLAGESIENLMRKYNLTKSDLKPFMPTDIEKIFDSNLEIMHITDYINYNPQNNYYSKNQLCHHVQLHEIYLDLLHPVACRSLQQKKNVHVCLAV